MTLKNFVRRVAKKTNITIKDMNFILAAIGEEIINVVNEEGDVTPFVGIKFEKAYKNPKIGTNPQTLEKMEIPGKYYIKLKLGKAIRELVNS